MPYITNRGAAAYAKRREPFITNHKSIYGLWVHHREGDSHYTVYSYGTHWPMYIYIDTLGRWFENGDKYSVTTSKQMNQCRPSSTTTKLSADDMCTLDRLGYVQFTANTITGEAA